MKGSGRGSEGGRVWKGRGRERGRVRRNGTPE